MKVQRFLIALTVLNFGLLLFLLAQVKRVDADSVPAVLRARQLEILDDQGRIRASIRLHPADKTGKGSNGKPYPESVMLRLIDAEGRPFVKLGGSEQGAGLGLVGETDTTHALLKAEGAETLLKLTNKDGRQQLIKP
jgi:hypothetical protein